MLYGRDDDRDGIGALLDGARHSRSGVLAAAPRRAHAGGGRPGAPRGGLASRHAGSRSSGWWRVGC
jgi:hypothetical protein